MGSMKVAKNKIKINWNLQRDEDALVVVVGEWNMGREVVQIK